MAGQGHRVSEADASYSVGTQEWHYHLIAMADDYFSKDERMPENLTREQVLDILTIARSQGTPPDFSAASLQGLDLADIDLHGALLRGADLRWTSLCRANLAEADLYGANLQGTNLQGANLGRANLSHAHLHRADLRAAYLVDAELEGTDINKAVR